MKNVWGRWLHDTDEIRLFFIRILSLILMLLIVWAAALYDKGIYDLSFVDRPAEKPKQYDENQYYINERGEVVPIETVEDWQSETLHFDVAGAEETLDAFLASCKGSDSDADLYGGSFRSDSTVLCSVLQQQNPASAAYSLSNRAINVITRTADMIHSYKTTVTPAEELRPQLEAFAGYLLLDHGDGSFDLLQADGTPVLSGESFVNTHPTGLTDGTGNPIFKRADGAYIVSGGKLIAYHETAAPLANRTACIGGTGAATGEIELYSEGGLYGYRKKGGAALTPAVYTRAFSFSDGSAVAFDATDMYILNEAGATLYREAYTVSANWQTNIRLILPDTEGIESLGHFYFDHGLMRVRYRINYNLYDGYYDVKLSDDEILMDAVGNTVYPPSGYTMASYHDGILVVKNQYTGATGLMNAQGAWVVQPVFTDAKPCVQGLVPVQYNGKWGLVDTAGKFVMPPVCEAAPVISGGLITAHTAEKGWMVLQMIHTKKDSAA